MPTSNLRHGLKNSAKCAKCDDLIEPGINDWLYCDCRAIGLYFDSYGHNTAWAYDQWEDIVFVNYGEENDKRENTIHTE